jgi:hypothetical protein
MRNEAGRDGWGKALPALLALASAAPAAGCGGRGGAEAVVDADAGADAELPTEADLPADGPFDEPGAEDTEDEPPDAADLPADDGGEAVDRGDDGGPGDEGGPGDAAEAGGDAEADLPDAAGDAADDATAADDAPGHTFFDDFDGDDALWELQRHSPGDIFFRAPSAAAHDGWIVRLLLDGDPALGVDDYAGPEAANQIATPERLHYGTYRARIKAAACGSPATEEVVTGLFVWWNDGTDADGNGIADNHEIDIEITCSSPHVIWLTAWTDYTDGTSFLKVTRMVDMRTGHVLQTLPGDEGSWNVDGDLGTPIPELPVPAFDAAAAFHELGFEWRADRIRWFVVVGDREVDLWDLTDAARVPRGPAQFMLNVWHDRGQWDEDGGPGDYPATDAVLEADWAAYDP